MYVYMLRLKSLFSVRTHTHIIYIPFDYGYHIKADGKFIDATYRKAIELELDSIEE